MSPRIPGDANEIMDPNPVTLLRTLMADVIYPVNQSMVPKLLRCQAQTFITSTECTGLTRMSA